MEKQEAEIWLTAKQFAGLAGIGHRTAKWALRSACSGNSWRGTRLQVRLVPAAAGGGAAGKCYQVLLASLPVSLQVKWHQQRAGAAPGTLAEQPPSADEEGARAEARDRPWGKEERERRHAAFAQLATSIQAQARRKLRAVQLFRSFDGSDVPMLQRYAVAAQDAGESVSTIRRWVGACAGHDPGDWLIVLAPNYKGGQLRAEISPDAYEYIKQEYFKLTQPALRPIYRRAGRLAPEKGWRLSSYGTVKRRIQGEPHSYYVLMREGREALEKLYPAMERDFSTLKLHELWCADGRKADVFVRWEDGEIGRPIVVAWIDLRSRVCLGYVIGRTESADLIRLAFKDAAEKSHALPEAALIDNGRGFASKLLTGGAPNRFRFKVREEDVPGILTLMGIKIHWTTPYLARAKPIEPWWRNLAEMDKRFPGAYCGNKPDAKPEDFDRKNAVPIEHFRKILAETLSEYHNRPHRGSAMDASSPRAVYEDLLQNTVVRQPTREQLRLCLLAAEKVRLDAEDHSVRIVGNRYWTEKLATLPREVEYCVRFNPENAAEPVSVYRGDTLICAAPLRERTGFRDQQAMKNHARAKRRFVKSCVEQAGLTKDMNKAAAWIAPPGVPDEPQTAVGRVVLPAPKVVIPLRPVRDPREDKPEEPIIPRDEFLRIILEHNQRRSNEG